MGARSRDQLSQIMSSYVDGSKVFIHRCFFMKTLLFAGSLSSYRLIKLPTISVSSLRVRCAYFWFNISVLSSQITFTSIRFDIQTIQHMVKSSQQQKTHILRCKKLIKRYFILISVSRASGHMQASFLRKEA